MTAYARSIRAALAILFCLAAGTSQTMADVQLTGDFEQGSLVYGKVTPGALVTQDGRPVRISKEGDFLIGFNRDAAPSSVLEITLPGGEKLHRALQVKTRKYAIERIDGLAPAKVTPIKPEVLARIRAETKAAKQARTLDDPRTDFLAGFNWPLIGPVTGVYGSQRILNGIPKRPHYGVDVAAPTGTPVTAPAPGIVTLAHPDMYFSGGTIILDHGHGLSSSFLHLNKILIKQGQRVEKGQLIAEVGSSGRSTGAHLDWRINLFDKRLDAAKLVGPMPELATAKADSP